MKVEKYSSSGGRIQNQRLDGRDGRLDQVQKYSSSGGRDTKPGNTQG